MDKRLKMGSELVQLTLNWETTNGDPVANVMYVHRQHVTGFGDGTDTPFDDSSADSAAAHLIGAVGSIFCPLLCNDVQINSCAWVWNEAVDTGPLHEGLHVPGAPVPGGVSGESLPFGIAKCVEGKTGLGGRGNHGRTFYTGIPVASVQTSDPDLLTNSAYAAWQAAAGGFLAAANWNDLIAGTGFTYAVCVASFILRAALRPVAVHHDYTEMVCRVASLEYQRRRAVGHGRHH